MVIVINPVSVETDGVKIRPEHMEKEKLYHCIFNNKILVFYKDAQDLLNCYEIEEAELVEKIKTCKNDEVEKLFEEYIEQKKLKH
ncbi:MAG: hypothetical protein ACT4OW_07550 [Nitrososphaerota archaeon]